MLLTKRNKKRHTYNLNKMKRTEETDAALSYVICRKGIN